jgi:FAD/FMN-containing dehydrogenase
MVRESPGTPGRYLSAPNEVGEEMIPHADISTLAPLACVDSRAGPGGHTCFDPSSHPSGGSELYEWYKTANARCIEYNFDFQADFHVYGRYIVAIQLTIYNFEEKRVFALQEALMRDGAELGYVEYRTHVKYQDDVASKLTFNGGARNRFATLLKDTLDPNGVLSPGKGGVWNSKTKGEVRHG